MKSLRLLAVVFVCLVALGTPNLVQAARGGGAATNIIDGVCYWSCYGGSTGSAPMTPWSSCLNLCSWACNGPCIALY
jgi:hypothetical protein